MLIDIEKISSILTNVRNICDSYCDCNKCPFFVEDKDEGYEGCEVDYPYKWGEEG